ncbi:MAG: hypothetical protein K9M19_06450 [Candidatus Marinimicrobia bacterium]|nr:hypothetical protein [Candidatus Neomarinimicrobiota bacterium]
MSAAQEKPKNIWFRYHFIRPDADPIIIEIELDGETLDLVKPKVTDIPDWTTFERLPCPQCGDCAAGGHCPIAVNLSYVVKKFDGVWSYDELDVLLETEERSYANHTTAQRGLGSLLGIIMTTSGCEPMNFLKPMTRFHLPFSTLDETIYRVAGMYLLGQHFRRKQGLEPDWTMAKLSEKYAKVDAVNANIVKRLQSATDVDSSMNAVIVLDSFAKMLPFSLLDELQNMEYLFKTYLNEGDIITTPGEE